MSNKERQKRYRTRQKALRNESVTPQNVTPQESKNVTEEMVPASYVSGLNQAIKTLPERPRYLTLSDGQVLDRTNQPVAADKFHSQIINCNEATYNYIPAKEKARLARA